LIGSRAKASAGQSRAMSSFPLRAGLEPLVILQKHCLGD
jgi:hypothetical protein